MTLQFNISHWLGAYKMIPTDDIVNVEDQCIYDFIWMYTYMNEKFYILIQVLL